MAMQYMRAAACFQFCVIVNVSVSYVNLPSCKVTQYGRIEILRTIRD
jgi:hypothetical protein